MILASKQHVCWSKYTTTRELNANDMESLKNLYLTSSVQALLPQSVLASELGLVLAVPALAAIVILQTTSTFTTKHSIANALVALARIGRRGCLHQRSAAIGWNVSAAILNPGFVHLLGCQLGIVLHRFSNGMSVFVVRVARCSHLLLRGAVAQVEVWVLWRSTPTSSGSCW